MLSDCFPFAMRTNIVENLFLHDHAEKQPASTDTLAAAAATLGGSHLSL